MIWLVWKNWNSFICATFQHSGYDSTFHNSPCLKWHSIDKVQSSVIMANLFFQSIGIYIGMNSALLWFFPVNLSCHFSCNCPSPYHSAAAAAPLASITFKLFYASKVSPRETNWIIFGWNCRKYLVKGLSTRLTFLGQYTSQYYTNFMLQISLSCT